LSIEPSLSKKVNQLLQGPKQGNDDAEVPGKEKEMLDGRLLSNLEECRERYSSKRNNSDVLWRKRPDSFPMPDARPGGRWCVWSAKKARQAARQANTRGSVEDERRDHATSFPAGSRASPRAPKDHPTPPSPTQKSKNCSCLKSSTSQSLQTDRLILRLISPSLPPHCITQSNCSLHDPHTLAVAKQ